MNLISKTVCNWYWIHNASFQMKTMALSTKHAIYLLLFISINYYSYLYFKGSIKNTIILSERCLCMVTMVLLFLLFWPFETYWFRVQTFKVNYYFRISMLQMRWPNWLKSVEFEPMDKEHRDAIECVLEGTYLQVGIHSIQKTTFFIF
jgi:hypothetical protein